VGYLDYQLFNAIAQDSGYAQKSAQKQREMAYVGELEQRAEKRNQEQMVHNEAMNQYLESVQEKLKSFLPEDVERLRNKEQEAKNQVMSAVRDSGGDMKRFFITGGASSLRSYKNDILNSDQAVLAQKNLGVYNGIQKDMAEGRLFHDVNVNLKQGDSDATERVSIEQMLQLFKEGKTDMLTYNGSVEAVDIDPYKLLKQGSPRSPYKPTRANLEEVAALYQAKGLPSDIAWREAQKLAIDEQGNTGLWWGVKDFDWKGMYKYQTANQKMRRQQQKFAPIMQNMLKGQMLKLEDIETVTWKPGEDGEHERVEIGNQNVSKPIMNAILDNYNLKQEIGGGWSGKFNTTGFVNLNDGKGIPMRQNQYELLNVHNGMKIVKDGSGAHAFVMADLKISESMAEDMGIEHWAYGVHKPWQANEAAVKTDETGTEDSYTISVGVPLNLAPLEMEMLNAQIAHKEGQTVGGVEFEDYSAQTFLSPFGKPLPMGSNRPSDQYQSNYGLARGYQRADNISEDVMRISRETGYPPEVIMQYMTENAQLNQFNTY